MAQAELKIPSLADSMVPESMVLPVATPRLTMMDLMLRHLKAEGVTVVFGVPGGLLHPFFDAIECDPDVQLVVNKHEGSAAFMADGFARLEERLAVVAATSGPGATNMITGVSVAFADGVPMLVITGQAPSHMLGKGAAQETPREDIDIVGMFKPITKYSAMVPSADRFAHHFRRAMRQAYSGRPGPVHLNVPVNLWLQPVDDEPWAPESYRAARALFDREAIKRASLALLRAKRPVLLVGSGVVGDTAQSRVIQFAEQLNLPVATTPRAKGVFPEDHRLSLGVLGFAGHDLAREVLLTPAHGVDVLLTVGASLNETTTLNWHAGLTEGRTLLQLDIDPERIGRNYQVQVPLVGDAATILLELSHQVRRDQARGEECCSTWVPLPRAPQHSQMVSVSASGGADSSVASSNVTSSAKGYVSPEVWRQELTEVLPGDAIIYSDIGAHMLFNIRHLAIRRGQRFVLNLGFGSMGHGTVAPIGTAIAYPGRPVVAIVGDACLTMNGLELLTAAEHQVPVVWIVEDNQMHGITFHGSKLVNGGRPMHSIVNRRELRIDLLAEALGLAFYDVSEPGQLREALPAALKQRGPSLIRVRVDPSISPPLGDRAKTVAGFKRS
ncbi:MAG: thiamine pyrophosphate-binding protein [Polyangiaceae bacterium]|nr:thiamine pyrophosphate-binding protein [Polyangiaceae bacterium]